MAEEDIGDGGRGADRPLAVPRHSRPPAAGTARVPVPRAADEAPAGIQRQRRVPLRRPVRAEDRRALLRRQQPGRHPRRRAHRRRAGLHPLGARRGRHELLACCSIAASTSTTTSIWSCKPQLPAAATTASSASPWRSCCGTAARPTATPTTSRPIRCPTRRRTTVLLLGAVGDHQVTEYSLRVEAATLGAAAHVPIAAAGRVDRDRSGLAAHARSTSTRYRGSAYFLWDTGSPSSPVGNVPPREGHDPHDDTPNIPEVQELKRPVLASRRRRRGRLRRPGLHRADPAGKRRLIRVVRGSQSRTRRRRDEGAHRVAGAARDLDRRAARAAHRTAPRCRAARGRRWRPAAGAADEVGDSPHRQPRSCIVACEVVADVAAPTSAI